MPMHDTASSNSVLTAIAQTGDLPKCREFFDRMVARDVVSWTAMAQALSENNEVSATAFTFEKMPQWNIVTWNVILAAFSQGGDLETSKRMFDKMPSRNVVSWTAMASAPAIDFDGRCRYCNKMPMHDTIAYNSMIATLGSNGKITEAEDIFETMPERNVISWNSLLASYAQNRKLPRARCLFDKMPRRNEISWTSMLQAYEKNGDIEEVKSLFDEAPTRDIRLYTTAIAAYAYKGHLEHAKNTFRLMPLHDNFALTALIVATAQASQPMETKSMFDRLVNSNSVAWTALIHAYARFGHLHSAEETFHRIPLWDLQSWSLMLVAYERNERFEDVQRVFNDMPEHDEVSWNIMLAASYRNCTSIETLEKLVATMPRSLSGCWVLIAAWSARGQIAQAKQVFDESFVQGTTDGYCWNAMLGAYVQNGQGLQAIEWFRVMVCYGASPDDASFLHLFTACSHAGLVDECRHNFVSMVQDHGVEATREHFGVMIDSLARNGRLDEAKLLAEAMPFRADSVTCRILLGGCKLHTGEELGKATGASAMEFATEDKSSSNYIILSNIYQSPAICT